MPSRGHPPRPGLCARVQNGFSLSTNTARAVLQGLQPAALPRALPVQNSSASSRSVCFCWSSSTNTKPHTRWAHTGSQHCQLQVCRDTGPQVTAEVPTWRVLLNYSHGIVPVTEQLSGCGAHPSSSRAEVRAGTWGTGQSCPQAVMMSQQLSGLVQLLVDTAPPHHAVLA